MIKAYEIVADWPKKPDVDDALEAFRDELLTLDASKYFHVEISEA